MEIDIDVETEEKADLNDPLMNSDEFYKFCKTTTKNQKQLLPSLTMVAAQQSDQIFSTKADLNNVKLVKEKQFMKQKECSICKHEFDVFFRKHHCRACGKTACSQCCRQNTKTQNVRLCDKCYVKFAYKPKKIMENHEQLKEMQAKIVELKQKIEQCQQESITAEAKKEILDEEIKAQDQKFSEKTQKMLSDFAQIESIFAKKNDLYQEIMKQNSELKQHNKEQEETLQKTNEEISSLKQKISKLKQDVAIKNSELAEQLSIVNELQITEEFADKIQQYRLNDNNNKQ